MLSTTVLANLLLATAALAAPKGGLGDRIARRANGGVRRTNLIQKVEHSTVPGTEASNVEYSSNWTGAVDVATTATYKSVTGTFTVPTPKEPSGGSSSTTYSASAWVGIDGDTCGNAILQTGVDFNVKGTSVSYDAWYEWYPDYAYDFSGITFSAGDSVTVTVTATSTKAGTAVITNNTTGKTVSKSLTSSYALCEYNAEWIVEDYEEGSSLVPLANWGTVTFTGISPSAAGATLIELEQNSKVLSSVSATSSSVTITYV
ncbi:hypothetical protein DL93DRAFT_2081712 [Clavulina sp. PMI_390]|nr:hypothetical protein DL93DRAFT_2081712 [Clavulina sp. PMI_390]